VALKVDLPEATVLVPNKVLVLKPLDAHIQVVLKVVPLVVTVLVLNKVLDLKPLGALIVLVPSKVLAQVVTQLQLLPMLPLRLLLLLVLKLLDAHTQAVPKVVPLEVTVLVPSKVLDLKLRDALIVLVRNRVLVLQLIPLRVLLMLLLPVLQQLTLLPMLQ